MSAVPLQATTATARPRFERYPGAKAGAGVYQQIINQFPPHAVYIEAFVGSGQIFLRKRPAEASIVIDADAAVALHWQGFARVTPALTALHGDSRSIIAGLDVARDRRTLIYCDPPYVRASRRNASPLYRHELTDQDHRELLELLASLPAMVALSGYRTELHDELLAGWRRVDYTAPTRRGGVTESLWCNYPEPAQLHDFAYLGANYRERERIKRKRGRWRRRLAAMPPSERRAMLLALAVLELASPAVAALERALASTPPGPTAKPGDAAGADPLAVFSGGGSRIVRLGGKDLAPVGQRSAPGSSAGASVVDVAACATVASPRA